MTGQNPSRQSIGAVGCLAVVLLLLVATPSAASADGDGEAVLAAVQEEPFEPDGLCGLAPGVIGDLCDVAGSVIGGGVGVVVGGGANAVLGAMVSFVVDGAGWLLDRLATFIDSSTSPDLRARWFRAAYRDMALIGMLGLLPFLLLALLQALLRQDAGTMLRATFGYVPLAAIGTAGAIVVVDLLVQLTDQLSAWIARGLGSDLSSFATGVGTALARNSAPAGGAVAGLAALIGAALIAFAAFVIWLELLLRQAAIYVAVLFFPLGFMAMVWPATAHWVRRLAQGLVAIILSKFVIVAVMALAASALDVDVDVDVAADDGFGVVMSGGALLGLAALHPTCCSASSRCSTRACRASWKEPFGDRPRPSVRRRLGAASPASSVNGSVPVRPPQARPTSPGWRDRAACPAPRPARRPGRCPRPRRLGPPQPVSDSRRPASPEVPEARRAWPAGTRQASMR